MGGVKLLDHLDAGAAVFGDLIDVGAFHEVHTDVGMAKAVGHAPVPVAVELGARENPVEQLNVVAGKHVLHRPREFLLRRSKRQRRATVAATALPLPPGRRG